MDVELLVGASAEFERVVGEYPADGWGLRTPCAVDARELVEHVEEGNWFAVAVLGGASAVGAGAAFGGVWPLSVMESRAWAFWCC
ncbi:hypothetical protein HPO96_11615 [Kribbella sandramycini]|uniref:Mycothiol maleylpyruvate isomerase-like protein n=1 Tax=Kribbella sandramycini TaxID=60450 RepID=A0A7Y4P093_9ACTN|nr:hypothetical protein [Kribbella sandramycini]MBB6569265.1 hypothetical protein [Kribbella sandramycini]NOL40895.1 hypothetical protein [Kribbella sandramycini]